MKLREEDRRAVDVLLDRGTLAASRAPGSSLYAAADGKMRESVARVEKMLVILDHMPPVDPPRGLAWRTLRLVERTTGRKVGDAQSALFNHPPVA